MPCKSADMYHLFRRNFYLHYHELHTCILTYLVTNAKLSSKSLRRLILLCYNDTKQATFSSNTTTYLKAWKSTWEISKNLEVGCLCLFGAPTGRSSGVTEKNDKILSQDSRGLIRDSNKTSGVYTPITLPLLKACR
jgi:hypothetical protein